VVFVSITMKVDIGFDSVIVSLRVYFVGKSDATCYLSSKYFTLLYRLLILLYYLLVASCILTSLIDLCIETFCISIPYIARRIQDFPSEWSVSAYPRALKFHSEIIDGLSFSISRRLNKVVGGYYSETVNSLN